MEEKKVIHSAAEKELMSLAHEILRHRNRMSIADMQAKALAIIELTSLPNKEEKVAPVEFKKTPTALEDVLKQPIKEATFERVEDPFVESLFEGNNLDYQRVMSMLNSKENANEATTFIEQQIRPDYDWSTKKQEVEAFLAHVTRLYE